MRLDGVIWEVSCREESFAAWWVGQDDLIDLFPIQFIWFSFPSAERWGREVDCCWVQCGVWWCWGLVICYGVNVFLGCDSVTAKYFKLKRTF